MAAPTAAAPTLSKKRRILVWTLVLLATVLALVSILTTWVNRQMLDDTAWNKATAQVIQDPQVQTALGDFTVNQLYENINVTQALQQHLPPTLKPLAPQLSGALQGPAARAVTLLLQRPRVQSAFIEASSVAHQKLVAVLENKTCCGISTGSGVVTLNAHELVVEVGTQLGLSSDVLAQLPNRVGTITLMNSDQLAAAQTGVRAIHELSIWLLVVVLVLYGLAIYLARGARRATLRNAGLGLAIAGLITLVIRRLLGNYLTDALSTPGYQPATHRLYLIGTSILGQIGQAAVLYGVVAALAAVFAGPSRPAVWLRQRLAPTLNEQQGIVWGAVGFIYVLLVLWGGTHALRQWWGILLLGALIALGVVALRRQTMTEFPSGAEAAPVPTPATDAPAADDRVAQLARLHELHQTGAISDDEFERAKKIALT
ncbi:MAG TPA: SHOCT domain-containing protein [Gaiellaceae bacterium]